MNYAKVSPRIINPLYKSYEEIHASELDQALILLVETRVSQINGCAYCCHLHAEEGRNNHGIEQVKLDKLPAWFNSNIYSPKEKLALEWCEALTTNPKQSTLDKIKEHLDAVFTEKEIVDLTAAISLMNALNRMAVSLGDRNE
ncbi:carboxymuconolactone decarboxylase family protein [Xenorhabdus lircayensis]|uniref:Carboxymuconolactone decarboxylase family protein n=1 Tax=Xenorhabdus lircayensis TaxID=2763499 RepID=A0ABS0U648_9GAMM|nr:carboxymuconolactone decarboxylase family protein [Xenorhabdus lircayensis]MBI6549356.1 carboxymuconolactone decarboxylase family protein [Xenorhabdus lircayensis]